jgi:hypothetical protein
MTDPSENIESITESVIIRKPPTLEQCIHKWVSIDNQLKELQEKMKPLREWKHKLTNHIDLSLKEKKWTNRVIEINYTEKGTGEGDKESVSSTILLKMVEKKEYGSLTYGYIEKCLTELIPEKSQVDFIIQYLKDHREIKQVPEFKRI